MTLEKGEGDQTQAARRGKEMSIDVGNECPSGCTQIKTMRGLIDHSSGCSCPHHCCISVDATHLTLAITGRGEAGVVVDGLHLKRKCNQNE